MAKSNLPETVDQTVKQLLDRLSSGALRRIRLTAEGGQPEPDFDLGSYERNSFGLWRNNIALLAYRARREGLQPLKSAGGKGIFEIRPEEATAVIIMALWEKLQQEK